MSEIKRVEELDVIKAVCIILIVMHHVEHKIMGTDSFFVLGFYFVMGFTLSRAPFHEFFLKKIKRIYLPFVAANLFAAAAVQVIACLTGGDFDMHSVLSGQMIRYILHILLFDLQEPVMSPSWFLLPLMVSLILLWLIVKYVKHYILVPFAIFFAAEVFRGSILQVTWNNCAILYNIALALAVGICGYVYRLNYEKVQDKIKSYAMDMMVICAVAVRFIGTHFGYAVDTRIGQHTNEILFLLSSAAGLCFLITFSFVIVHYSKTKAILVYIGQRSMTIMFFHVLAFNLVTMICYKHIPSDYTWTWTHAIRGGYFPFINAAVGILVPLVCEYIYRQLKKMWQHKYAKATD